MRTTPYAPTHDQAADAYTLALLEQLTLKRDKARARVVTARQDRDDAIRALLAAGHPPAEVARAARLTTVRIGQIRRRTR